MSARLNKDLKKGREGIFPKKRRLNKDLKKRGG
jgi:hypothetical protein